MLEKIVKETKLGVAIVAELVLGFVTWLLIVGLVPADHLDFDVLGSLVMIVMLGVPYWAAHRYVKTRTETRS